MPKISEQVLSKKPVSLSRAAKLISRFAAVENGSTPAVSLYLERAAEAFNHLVQFHKKPLYVGDKPDLKRVQKLQSDWLEKNSDGEKGTIGEEDRKNVIYVAETNPRVDEEENRERKKKKKRETELVDSMEKKVSKKRKT